jgi:hypothetical protein
LKSVAEHEKVSVETLVQREVKGVLDFTFHADGGVQVDLLSARLKIYQASILR